jgi:hypothetical protein
MRLLPADATSTAFAIDANSIIWMPLSNKSFISFAALMANRVFPHPLTWSIGSGDLRSAIGLFPQFHVSCQ